MFNKLRKKFVLITMISMIAVLAIIISIINIVNYMQVYSYADDVLDVLQENNGDFGEFGNPNDSDTPPEPPNGEAPKDEFLNSDRMHKGMNEETPFETRFFSVAYESDSSATVHLEQIAAVTEDKALQMAQTALESSSKNGTIGNYRYLVCDDSSLVIFVDCTRQLDTAGKFLIISIAVSLVGTLCVFLLVFLLSKKVVRPISESYEKQKRFITDAGHELKTPLTIISANNELSELINGQTESSEAISKQVVRMTAMVKNLTELAKLDEGNESIKMSKFSLSDAVSDAADIFTPNLTSNGRHFESHVDSGIIYNGSESMLRKLLSILLENATKYAVSHTSLKLMRVGRKIELTVSNDAKGIKSGNLDRCFERFYRSDEARAGGIDGSGIGLSIAKEIVTLHKGHISAYGSGDTFTISVTL